MPLRGGEERGGGGDGPSEQEEGQKGRERVKREGRGRN